MQLRILVAICGGIVSAACGSRAAPLALPATSASQPIDTVLLREISRQLSSDALQGRRTGSLGGAQAATLIAWYCYTLGLRSVSSTEYYQYVPLIDNEIDETETRLRIIGPGVDTTFFHHEEFIVDVGRKETLTDFSGELVYVGRAADLLFQRSSLPPLEGKVALLRGELGGWPEAADTLMVRGAVGIIQVVDDARRYRLFRATRGRSRLYIDDAAVPSAALPLLPMILAGPRMTMTLFQGLTGGSHGSWNDAYLNGLAEGLPTPRSLPGWRAAVSIGVRERSLQAPNVACRLEGHGAAADTALVLVAHYDHLGIGAADLKGDSIYNGFSDNAAGVAMALGIADWFAHERALGRGLRHSLLLLFPTGEEAGLLGSEYFLSHSAWPTSRMLAALNLDANVPAGRPRSWRVAGDEGSRVVRTAVAEAQRHGWPVSVARPAPASDYYAFLMRGVPAAFIVPGGGAYEDMRISTSDSLRALLQSRYHQPADEYASDFPFEGIERYAEFIRDVLRRLDGPASGERFAARETSNVRHGR